MSKTSDRSSARERARAALAEKQRLQRERDARMEKAATAYFVAAEQRDAADAAAAQAIRDLAADELSQKEIVDLLGISTREAKAALSATDGNDEAGQSGDPVAGEHHE